MNYLSNALLLVTTNALLQACSLIVRVVLARTLGPVLYGSFGLGLNANTLSVRIFSFGLVPSAQYHASSQRERTSEVFWTVILTNMVFALLALMICYSLLPMTEHLFFANHPDGLLVYKRFLPFLPIVFLSMSLSIMLIPLKKVIQYSLLQIITSVLLPLLLLLGLIFLTPLNALINSQIFVWICGLAIPLIILRRHFATITINLDLVRSMLRYAIFAWPNVMINVGIARFGTLYAGTMLTTTEIGLFFVALNINEGLFGLHGAMTQLLLTKVSEKVEDGARITQQLFRISMLSLILLSVVYLLIGKPLLLLLFGDKFCNSWVLSIILLLRGYSHELSRLNSNYFGGIGRPQLNAIPLCIEFASLIALIAMLGREYGASGFCYACTISATLALIVSFEIMRRNMACKYVALLVPQKKDFQLLYKQAKSLISSMH